MKLGSEGSGAGSGLGGGDDFANLLITLGAEAFHDHVLDMVGVRYLTEEKIIFLGSGLDFDIAKVENSRDHTAHFGSHVLDTGKLEFTHRPDKKPLLFDIDNALIGNDPHIEIVINPNEKGVHPEKKKKGILEKKDKRLIGKDPAANRKSGEGKEAPKNQSCEEDNENEVSGDVEPVAMDDSHNDFAFALSSEMVAAKIRSHKNLQGDE